MSSWRPIHSRFFVDLRMLPCERLTNSVRLMIVVQLLPVFWISCESTWRRQQSRPLDALSIITDLGLESLAYSQHADSLLELIREARRTDSSVALATELWSRFVDHLEHLSGVFRESVYLDEVYITLLARLLSANVLLGKAQLSDDYQLAAILSGRFFEEQFHLRNMVEKDYFGWLMKPTYLPSVLPVCREIQHDLYVYDFTAAKQEDLFGRLIAQFTRRSARRLLGQEWTPRWLARELALKCLGQIPAGEFPRLVEYVLRLRIDGLGGSQSSKDHVAKV